MEISLDISTRDFQIYVEDLLAAIGDCPARAAAVVAVIEAGFPPLTEVRRGPDRVGQGAYAVVPTIMAENLLARVTAMPPSGEVL
jgi:hypothetical protein